MRALTLHGSIAGRRPNGSPTGRSAKALALVIAASASLIDATPARADDVQACLDAHENSQLLRRDGKLRAAREQLILCARDTCPSVLRKECGPWLGEVNAAMPSVTFTAHKDGHDALEVSVAMDGELLVTSLDGRAVDVDPGPHTFVFSLSKAKPVELKVVVREGEKAREVLADFGGSAAPPPVATNFVVGSDAAPETDTHRTRPVPMLSYVLGGIGVAALAGAAVFEVQGLSKRSDLDGQNCKPYCDKGAVDSAKQSLLIGDIALGVGALSLGTAAYLFFTRPAIDRRSPATALSVPTFGITALQGGAMTGVSGSF